MRDKPLVFPEEAMDPIKYFLDLYPERKDFGQIGKSFRDELTEHYSKLI
jgi:hypothetical protein